MGPTRGYYPAPTKSIVIPSQPEFTEKTKEVLGEFNFQYMEGCRYLGGFIGSEAALDDWLLPKIDQWVESIKIFGRIAKRYPQTAFAGLSKSLQMEWNYVQRIIPSISDKFVLIEKALTEHFLPALFGEGEVIGPAVIADLWDILCLPVKHAGLGIFNPAHQADHNFQVSESITKDISTSLRDNSELDAMVHYDTATAMLRAEKVAHNDQFQIAYNSYCEQKPTSDSRRLKRARLTGGWLTLFPNSLNGTELCADEFRDSLRL